MEIKEPFEGGKPEQIIDKNGAVWEIQPAGEFQVADWFKNIATGETKPRSEIEASNPPAEMGD
jgi:hypothetical protein